MLVRSAKVRSGAEKNRGNFFRHFGIGSRIDVSTKKDAKKIIDLSVGEKKINAGKFATRRRENL